MIDFPTLVSLSAILVTLLAGCVAYLVKVERTLARIDASLASFCSNQSAIWERLAESAEHDQRMIERVGILETKVALMPQGGPRSRPK